MHAGPLQSTSDGVKSSNDEAWFMNRVSKTGTTKTLTCVLQCNKQRSMEDILHYSLTACESQKHAQLCRVIDDRHSEPNSKLSTGLQTCLPTKPWAQLFADDDFGGIENMTLQDLQHVLRKKVNWFRSKEDSAEPASVNYSQSYSDSETTPSLDTVAPSVGMELLLEDSTSNSSDNLSFKGDSAGIPASGSIIGAHLHGKSEDVPRGCKRVSMEDGTGDAEDDEWTLQKWQEFNNRKHFGGWKRLKKDHKMQQGFSDSNGEVCSGNSLDLIGTSYGLSGIESPHLECSQGTTQFVNVMTRNYEDDSSDPVQQETGVSVMGPLPSTEKSAREDSSQLSASCSSHSTAGVELEAESKVRTSEAPLHVRMQKGTKTGWALKPCDKSVTTLLPVALPQLVLGVSRKAAQLSITAPERASAEVIEQRKQSEDMASLLLANVSGSSEQNTTTRVRCMDGDCKSKAVLSYKSRDSNAKQLHVSMEKDFSNPTSDQIDSTDPCLMDNRVSQSNIKGRAVSVTSLKCTEIFDIEEEQEPLLKPAKIPCKRKAISPMSQEFLLKASKLGEFGADAEIRGMKRLPLISNKNWVDVCKWRKKELSCESFMENERNGHNGMAVQGERQLLKASPSDSVVPFMMTSSRSPAQGQEISVVAPISHSKQESPSKLSPSGLSSSMPAKGILRLSCQGPCCCEECTSLRVRAERASEFSQRQMQDIEGLAVKLLKDLSTMRKLVEDRLLRTSSKHDSPQPFLSLDQVKKATSGAAETEEMAKKWLTRMARDCNRYCKIMRMQGRKLTFADESGGKLCHVKMFNTEPKTDDTICLHGGRSEADVSIASTPNQSSMEVICSTEGTSLHRRPLKSDGIISISSAEEAAAM